MTSDYNDNWINWMILNVCLSHNPQVRGSQKEGGQNHFKRAWRNIPQFRLHRLPLQQCWISRTIRPRWWLQHRGFREGFRILGTEPVRLSSWMLVIVCLSWSYLFARKANQVTSPHLPAKVMKSNVTGVFSMLKYVSKVMIDQQLGSGIGQEELK